MTAVHYRCLRPYRRSRYSHRPTAPAHCSNLWRSPAGSPCGITPVPSAVGDVIQMQLVGANAASQALGLEPQASVSNYLVGTNSSQWHTGVPNFGQVKFTGCWATVNFTTSSINGFSDAQALNMVASTGSAYTSDLPVQTNTLGFNEPKAGVSSSSFTVTYGTAPAGSEQAIQV